MKFMTYNKAVLFFFNKFSISFEYVFLFRLYTVLQKRILTQSCHVIATGMKMFHITMICIATIVVNFTEELRKYIVIISIGDSSIMLPYNKEGILADIQINNQEKEKKIFLMNLKGELLKQLQQISVEQNKTETKSNYCSKYHNDYYAKLIWCSKDYNDIEKIQIRLVVVENDDQCDLFDYIRHTVSSMPQCQVPGRVLSVLVYDQYSKSYLGIIQLTTDLLKSEFKDNYMNLDVTKRGRLKQHIRDHSANLSICVPVQPFGFDFCGGKLLAMLAFSIELHQFYEKRYSNSLALITTTSIHGKSVQYDRLKQLKFIGYTQGFGISHIPASFIVKAREFLKENYPESLQQKQSNWHLLKVLAQKLNINSTQLFYHGNQRGIYCGWTGTNANEFLLKKRTNFTPDKLQSVNDITTFWMQRWARQRSTHLNNMRAQMSENDVVR